MIGDSFPIPFAAIDRAVTVEPGENLRETLAVFDTCGHRHNIAVEYDGPGGLVRIWCTELAVSCLDRMLP